METTQIKTAGANWIVWVIFAVFAILSAIFMSGYGERWLKGYNKESREKRKNCNSKLLCKTVGIGMTAFTVVMLIYILFRARLGAWFEDFVLIFALADVIAMDAMYEKKCKQ